MQVYAIMASALARISQSFADKYCCCLPALVCPGSFSLRQTCQFEKFQQQSFGANKQPEPLHPNSQLTALQTGHINNFGVHVMM